MNREGKLLGISLTNSTARTDVESKQKYITTSLLLGPSKKLPERGIADFIRNACKTNVDPCFLKDTVSRNPNTGCRRRRYDEEQIMRAFSSLFYMRTAESTGSRGCSVTLIGY
jgi:hypothetical protein